jgi:15-cis-phytoene synthase
MSQARKTLDLTYRARAIPLGSVRYCSWLFAATALREPLLGVYALLAEWSALMDPATEHSAALIKLSWWQEEIRRLIEGRPVHPISTYLASLPGAAGEVFSPLSESIDATMAETSGAPLERGTDLAPHAGALRAGPLALASRLAGEVDAASLSECTRNLAVADYLVRAARDYRRDARFGRVPFAVDELLAAGIDNADLRAEHAPPPLQRYLQQQRELAAQRYAEVARLLPANQRARQRHLLVLATLGLKHSQDAAALESRRMQDMLLAWWTARGAHE